MNYLKHFIDTCIKNTQKIINEKHLENYSLDMHACNSDTNVFEIFNNCCELSLDSIYSWLMDNTNLDYPYTFSKFVLCLNFIDIENQNISIPLETFYCNFIRTADNLDYVENEDFNTTLTKSWLKEISLQNQSNQKAIYSIEKWDIDYVDGITLGQWTSIPTFDNLCNIIKSNKIDSLVDYSLEFWAKLDTTEDNNELFLGKIA